MNRIHVIAFLGALVGASPTAADDQASVTINATVPTSCAANLTITATGDNPQRIISADVQRDCNAVHTLTVTYQPTELTSNSLVILFDGSPPTGVGPGNAIFANLPMTNSTKVLAITYGGPKDERLEIGQTLAIQISVP
jgi:hypothetical protein